MNYGGRGWIYGVDVMPIDDTEMHILVEPRYTVKESEGQLCSSPTYTQGCELFEQKSKREEMYL